MYTRAGPRGCLRHSRKVPMKNVYTLVDDIYKLVKTKRVDKDVDIEECIEQFG